MILITDLSSGSILFQLILIHVMKISKFIDVIPAQTQSYLLSLF